MISPKSTTLVAAKTTQLAQVNFFQRCSEGNSSFNILLIGILNISPQVSLLWLQNKHTQEKSIKSKFEICEKQSQSYSEEVIKNYETASLLILLLQIPLMIPITLPERHSSLRSSHSLLYCFPLQNPHTGSCLKPAQLWEQLHIGKPSFPKVQISRKPHFFPLQTAT